MPPPLSLIVSSEHFVGMRRPSLVLSPRFR